MKKAIMILMVLTMTIGGCARPMNNGRPPRHERNHRKPAPPFEQPGPDHRPNSY